MADKDLNLNLDPLLTADFYKLPSTTAEEALELKLDFEVPTTKTIDDFLKPEAKAEQELFKVKVKEQLERLNKVVETTFANDPETSQEMKKGIDEFYQRHFENLDPSKKILYMEGPLKLAEFFRVYHASDYPDDLRVQGLRYFLSNLQTKLGSPQESLERGLEYLHLKMNFAIPTLDSFQTFVKGKDTSQLEDMKNGVKKLVIEMKKIIGELWDKEPKKAKELKDKFDSFYHVMYELERGQITEKYVDLYVEGSLRLARLVKEYRSDKHSQQKRKNNLSTLVEKGLDVCPPGTNINIKVAVESLNLDVIKLLKSIRKELARSLMQEACQVHELYSGNETHYVSAILNKNADRLGFDKDRDFYAAKYEGELSVLREYFAQNIGKYLSVEAIINKIKLELEMEAFIRDCRAKFSGQYTEKEDKEESGKMGKVELTQAFENFLAPFGEAKDWVGDDILGNSIFREVDEDLGLFELLPDAELEACIDLNLMLRLVNSGYVNPERQEILEEKEAKQEAAAPLAAEEDAWSLDLPQSKDVHLVPDKYCRLRLSFVTDVGKNRNTEPLLNYLLTQYRKHNQIKLHLLPKGETTNEFFDFLFKQEKARWQKLQEDERPLYLTKMQALMTTYLNQDSMDLENLRAFSALLGELPEIFQVQLLSENKARLGEVLTKWKDLGLFLRGKPEAAQTEILSALPASFLSAIPDFSHFSALLCLLNGRKACEILFKFCGKSWEKLSYGDRLSLLSAVAKSDKPYLLDLEENKAQLNSKLAHFAIEAGSVNFLKALKEKGDSLVDRGSMFDLAIDKNQQGVINLLSEWREEIKAELSKNCDVASINQLLPKASQILTPSEFGCVLFEVLAERGSRINFEELKKGPNKASLFPDPWLDPVIGSNQDTMSIFSRAARDGNLKALKYALEYPQNQEVDMYPFIALYWKAGGLEGHAKIVKYCLNLNPRLSSHPQLNEMSANAQDKGYVDVLKVLKEAGAELKISAATYHETKKTLPKASKDLFVEWKNEFSLEFKKLMAKSGAGDLRASSKLRALCEKYEKIFPFLALIILETVPESPSVEMQRLYDKLIKESWLRQAQNIASLAIQAIKLNKPEYLRGYVRLHYMDTLFSDPSPLSYAFSLLQREPDNNRLALFKILKEGGADFLSIPGQYKSPREAFKASGQDELVKLFDSWEEALQAGLKEAVEAYLSTAEADPSKLRDLKDKYIKFFPWDDFIFNILRAASKVADFKRLDKLLEDVGLTINPGMGSILQQAVKEKNIALVSFLCSRGVEVNFQDVQGNTAAHLAAEVNAPLEIYSILLEHKADLSIVNKSNISPRQLKTIASKEWLTRLEEKVSSHNHDYSALLSKEFVAVTSASMLLSLAATKITDPGDFLEFVKSYKDIAGADLNRADGQDGSAFVHCLPKLPYAADILPELVNLGLDLNLKDAKGQAITLYLVDAVNKNPKAVPANLKLLEKLKDLGVNVAIDFLSLDKANKPIQDLYLAWEQKIRNAWSTSLLKFIDSPPENKEKRGDELKSLMRETFQILSVREGFPLFIGQFEGLLLEEQLEVVKACFENIKPFIVSPVELSSFLIGKSANYQAFILNAFKEEELGEIIKSDPYGLNLIKLFNGLRPEKHYLHLVELLIKYEIKLDALALSEMLKVALRHNRIAALPFLKKLGGESGLGKDMIAAALHEAVRLDNMDMLKLLMGEETQVKDAIKAGMPLQFYALQLNNTRIFEYLYQKGINLNEKYKGESLPDFALQHCTVETLVFLKEKPGFSFVSEGKSCVAKQLASEDLKPDVEDLLESWLEDGLSQFQALAGKEWRDEEALVKALEEAASSCRWLLSSAEIVMSILRLVTQDTPDLLRQAYKKFIIDEAAKFSEDQAGPLALMLVKGGGRSSELLPQLFYLGFDLTEKDEAGDNIYTLAKDDQGIFDHAIQVISAKYRQEMKEAVDQLSVPALLALKKDAQRVFLASEFAILLLQTFFNAESEPTEPRLKALTGLLRAANIDLNQEDDSGKALIHAAAMRGDSDLIKQLALLGADLNAATLGNKRAVHLALVNGKIEAFKTLQSLGAELYHEDDIKRTTVWALAERRGYKEIASLKDSLMKDFNESYDAYVNHFDPDLPEEKQLELLKPVVSLNRQLIPLQEFVDDYLRPLLNRGNKQIAKLLLKAYCKLPGVDVNATTDSSSYPIHMIVKTGDVFLLNTLIDLGADLNVRDSDGRTPAHVAALEGYFESLKRLNEAGALLGELDNDEDGENKTPKELAIAFGAHNDMLKWFDELEAKVIGKILTILRSCENNPQIANEETLKAFAAACKEGQRIFGKASFAFLLLKDHLSSDLLQPCIQLMKAVHYDFNEQDLDGETVLIKAYRSTRFDIFNTFLQMGADINARFPDGNTMLHRAVFHYDLELARFLLEQGAAIDSKNSDNETPLEMAEASNRTEFIELLSKPEAESVKDKELLHSFEPTLGDYLFDKSLADTDTIKLRSFIHKQKAAEQVFLEPIVEFFQAKPMLQRHEEVKHAPEEYMAALYLLGAKTQEDYQGRLEELVDKNVLDSHSGFYRVAWLANKQEEKYEERPRGGEEDEWPLEPP